MQSVIAEFKKKSFNCPICNVYSRQVWAHFGINGNIEQVYTNLSSLDIPTRNVSTEYDENLSIALCSNCEMHSVWFNQIMIHPLLSSAPQPVENMPENVLRDFNEARNVFNISAKASAALLRLALQKLCEELGGGGKNINDDIQLLVRNGLPQKIQKALDIVRVIGNDSVHPGQIDVNDNPEIAISLFEMINIIVERMITEPQKIDKVYSSLPENKRKAIEDRDAKKE